MARVENAKPAQDEPPDLFVVDPAPRSRPVTKTLARYIQMARLIFLYYAAPVLRKADASGTLMQGAFNFVACGGESVHSKKRPASDVFQFEPVLSGSVQKIERLTWYDDACSEQPDFVTVRFKPATFHPPTKPTRPQRLGWRIHPQGIEPVAAAAGAVTELAMALLEAGISGQPQRMLHEAMHFSVVMRGRDHNQLPAGIIPWSCPQLASDIEIWAIEEMERELAAIGWFPKWKEAPLDAERTPSDSKAAREGVARDATDAMPAVPGPTTESANWSPPLSKTILVQAVRNNPRARTRDFSRYVANQYRVRESSANKWQIWLPDLPAEVRQRVMAADCS